MTLKMTAAVLAVQIQMFLTSLEKLSVKKHTLIVSMKNCGTMIQDRYSERKKYCMLVSHFPLKSENTALLSNMPSDIYFSMHFLPSFSLFSLIFFKALCFLISRLWFQLMNPGDYSTGIMSDSVNKT